jgi:hypothetical protein
MHVKIPAESWQVTPIWLKATAGLRMLKPAESGAILQSVRDYLNDDAVPFLFRDNFARVITGLHPMLSRQSFSCCYVTGNEEGGFGWIAFNYLKKIIGPKKIPDAPFPYAVVSHVSVDGSVSSCINVCLSFRSRWVEHLHKFLN